MRCLLLAKDCRMCMPSGAARQCDFEMQCAFQQLGSMAMPISAGTTIDKPPPSITAAVSRQERADRQALWVQAEEMASGEKAAIQDFSFCHLHTPAIHSWTSPTCTLILKGECWPPKPNTLCVWLHDSQADI